VEVTTTRSFGARPKASGLTTPSSPPPQAWPYQHHTQGADVAALALERTVALKQTALRPETWRTRGRRPLTHYVTYMDQIRVLSASSSILRSSEVGSEGRKRIREVTVGDGIMPGSFIHVGYYSPPRLTSTL